jgi:hypothetical protein
MAAPMLACAVCGTLFKRRNTKTRCSLRCAGIARGQRSAAKDLARLAAKTQMAGPHECWLWTGTVDGKGYGDLMVGTHRTKAHRLSYELSRGPIPSGMCVMHACDTPACVNPAHLSVGTHADNCADMHRKGRGKYGENRPSLQKQGVA